MRDACAVRRRLARWSRSYGLAGSHVAPARFRANMDVGTVGGPRGAGSRPKRLTQIDCAFGRAIFDELQLGRVTQLDFVPKFASQIARSVLERIHRLLGNVAIADNRHEDLRVPQILRDFDPRDRRKTETRVFEFLRDQRAEYALHLMIDALHPLPFHDHGPRRVLIRPRWSRRRTPR